MRRFKAKDAKAVDEFVTIDGKKQLVCKSLPRRYGGLKEGDINYAVIIRPSKTFEDGEWIDAKAARVYFEDLRMRTADCLFYGFIFDSEIIERLQEAVRSLYEVCKRQKEDEAARVYLEDILK